MVENKSSHSDTILILKFFLILGVVIIHCKFMPDMTVNPISEEIIDFIENIVSVSVPCFFIISGYLYFKNIEKDFYHNYIIKTRRRIRTLIVPYVLWNSIFLIYLIFKGYHMGNLYSIFPDGFYSVLKGFIYFENKMTYAFAFWFIRNLIVFCLLSPIVYALIKYSITFILLISVICVFNIDTLGFIFFVIGGYCGLHKGLLCHVCNLRKRLALVPLLMWICMSLNSFYFLILEYEILYILNSVSAIIFLYFFSVWLRRHYFNNKNRFLLSSTFFIYAVHQFFASPVKKILRNIINEQSFWGAISWFLLCFVSLVTISLLIWWIVKTISPKTEKVLSGGR